MSCEFAAVINFAMKKKGKKIFMPIKDTQISLGDWKNEKES